MMKTTFFFVLACLDFVAFQSLYACRAASYGEALDECSAPYDDGGTKTLTESRTCRCTVSKAYSRPCDQYVTLSDASTDQ